MFASGKSTRYVVKVGNRISRYPDLTRAFRTPKRAVMHRERIRRKGYGAEVYAVKPGDTVFAHVPWGDGGT